MKDEKVNEIRKSLAKLFRRFGLRDVDACVLAHLIIIDSKISVRALANDIHQSISGVTSALHRLMRMHLVIRDKQGKMYIYRTESNLLSALLNLIEDIRAHELSDLMTILSQNQRDSVTIAESLQKKVESADCKLKALVQILKLQGGEQYEDSTNC